MQQLIKHQTFLRELLRQIATTDELWGPPTLTSLHDLFLHLHDLLFGLCINHYCNLIIRVISELSTEVVKVFNNHLVLMLLTVNLRKMMLILFWSSLFVVLSFLLTVIKSLIVWRGCIIVTKIKRMVRPLLHFIVNVIIVGLYSIKFIYLEAT